LCRFDTGHFLASEFIPWQALRIWRGAPGQFFYERQHMTANLSKDKIAHFKQMLMDEKTRLETERRQYAGPDRDDTEEGAAGELSDVDPNDPGDEGANLYDRDRDQAAIENFDRMLIKVNRALQKIADGTYGLSDIDGTPIPVARLEALPYANITVEQSEDTLEG
jgi:DnaK suppressor protein